MGVGRTVVSLSQAFEKSCFERWGWKKRTQAGKFLTSRINNVFLNKEDGLSFLFPGGSCAAQPEVTLPHGYSVLTYKGAGGPRGTLESQASFFRDKSGIQQGDVRDVLRTRPRSGRATCVTTCYWRHLWGMWILGSVGWWNMCWADHPGTWAIAPIHLEVAQLLCRRNWTSLSLLWKSWLDHF